MKIQFSYYSHVTNASVLQQAGAQPMSSMPLESQLKAFARRNAAEVATQSVFDPRELFISAKGAGGPKAPRQTQNELGEGCS